MEAPWGRGWKRRLALAGAVIAGGGALLILIVEHKPRWYRPVVLDAEQLERVRGEAATTVDAISRQLVAGSPFELRLPERAVNEWLCAFLHHRPDVAGRLPVQVSDIAMDFDEGCLRLAALYDSDGWRAIVSLDAAVDVTKNGDELQLTPRRGRIGSMPVAMGIVERWLIQPAMAARRKRHEDSGRALSDLSEFRLAEGERPVWRIRNRFVWPNGERPFRIRSVVPYAGEVALVIEPLGDSHARRNSP